MAGSRGSRLDSPELRRALQSRIEYYRELGITDFYRRASSAAAHEDSGEALPGAAAVQHDDSAPQLSLLAPAASPAALRARPADPSAQLRLIREDLGECTRCGLHKGRTHIVFGVGDPSAQLMFVGEGPGADEDRQGEPFVGRAGQLLNKMIEAMGLMRENVYIANVVKCRPPGNRTPERDECDTCSPFLLRQIEAIAPKVIVALGAVAARNLLAVNQPMSALRGRWHDFRGTRLAVTYHPAFLLRDPRQKKESWKDLQMVMEFLGLPLPEKSPA